MRNKEIRFNELLDKHHKACDELFLAMSKFKQFIEYFNCEIDSLVMESDDVH